MHYTCSVQSVGTKIRLERGESIVEAAVAEAFDPPLWDKSKERVAKSHYFVKAFKPFKLGVLNLTAGRKKLTLSAPKIPGERASDVYSVVLEKGEK